jgi:hypothetical protein
VVPEKLPRDEWEKRAAEARRRAEGPAVAIGRRRGNFTNYAIDGKVTFHRQESVGINHCGRHSGVHNLLADVERNTVPADANSARQRIPRQRRMFPAATSDRLSQALKVVGYLSCCGRAGRATCTTASGARPTVVEGP